MKLNKLIKYLVVAVWLGLLIYFILQQNLSAYSFSRGKMASMTFLITGVSMAFIFIANRATENFYTERYEGFDDDDTNPIIPNNLLDSEETTIEESTQGISKPEVFSADLGKTLVNTVKTEVLDKGTGHVEAIQKNEIDESSVDIELEELERLQKQNEVLKNESSKIENAFRRYLYKNGIETAPETIGEVITSLDNKDKTVKTEKKNPYIILDPQKWMKTRTFYSGGCQLPLNASVGQQNYLEVADLE